MAKYTKVEINVPDVNRSYTQGTYNYASPSVIIANNKILDKILKSYTNYIDVWGTEFDVDNSIIACFIATESSGENLPPNKYEATGLMQVTPKTVWESLAKWKTIVKTPLSAKATSFFNKAIPSSKNYNPNVLPTPAVLSEISLALQKNSEFNIAIGTAVIRWLLEALKEGNVSYINKVMVSYNAGYYSMKRKVAGNLTTKQLLNDKSIPIESRSYLLKMLGVNGFLDLYFKRK